MAGRPFRHDPHAVHELLGLLEVLGSQEDRGALAVDTALGGDQRLLEPADSPYRERESVANVVVRQGHRTFRG